MDHVFRYTHVRHTHPLIRSLNRRTQIMHESSILRMQWFEQNFAANIKKPNISVLDVGSYDVNGTYKPIFNNVKYNYTGLDMEAGPNVDIVLETPYNWESIPNDSYDIVISGQAFEHILR